MYLVIFLFPVFIAIAHVFVSSELTKTNIEIEELKKDIEKQNDENESLEMQIDELASLENIQEVAKIYGLSFDNTNILIIK